MQPQTTDTTPSTKATTKAGKSTKKAPHPAGPQRTNIVRQPDPTPEPTPAPAPAARSPLAKPAPQKPTPRAVRWWNRISDGATAAVIEAHPNNPPGNEHAIYMQGIGIAHRDTLEAATDRAANYLATIGPASAFKQHDAQ
jgi:hypothetical protein